jgi:CheY-like chemotaxis protein
MTLPRKVAMAQNIRILILEDRASDADLVEFELLEAGLAFTPKRTANEKEFLRELEEFSPDLILSDYDLPQYNGALALAEAKRRLPGVPFILVTGVLDEGEDRIGKIIAGGASGCVLKGHLDRLALAVHKVIGMRRGT